MTLYYTSRPIGMFLSMNMTVLGELRLAHQNSFTPYSEEC